MTNLNFTLTDGMYQATYTTVSDHDVLQISLPYKSQFYVYARIPNTQNKSLIFQYPHSVFDRDLIFTLNVPAGIQLVFEASSDIDNACILEGE